jgi:hypothetical protein
VVRAHHDHCKLLHLQFMGFLLAQFIGKLLDSAAALSTSFGLTLAGKSLYSRRSGLIFGSDVLKCHLPSGRRAWWRPGIQAYMRENLLDVGALKDRRNARKRSTAVRAMFEDTFSRGTYIPGSPAIPASTINPPFGGL